MLPSGTNSPRLPSGKRRGHRSLGRPSSAMSTNIEMLAAEHMERIEEKVEAASTREAESTLKCFSSVVATIEEEAHNIANLKQTSAAKDQQC